MLACARSLFVAAALLVSLATPALAQSTDPAQRFELATDHEQPLRDLPQALDRFTVVLKMAGDSVATVRSRAPGKEISEGERATIEDNLRRQQESIEPTIEAMGGTVLAKFQYAINGIKVRATADQLLSMSQLPGVVGIKPVLTHTLNNAVSVPFIGAPAVWGGTPAFRGDHIKIAIIDTGTDYTHANFGGPGTVAAFDTAFAASTSPADPALFGPNAPKVKGGTDLVGDAYNANDPNSVPQPDPNPLDCNGHGSHVAGTAAGFGVRANGTTFPGPYNSSTPSVNFRIGPGVAPLADIYSVRVFGCAGSTNVVVEAIEWAVQHDMQVISMSLGADFGPSNSADAEASTQAAEAGLIVVAAAGNAGPSVYFTGSPASADETLSVAAMDSTASLPGAAIALSTGKTITAQNSNAAALPGGNLAVFVIKDTGKVGAGSGGVSLGCDESEYVDAQIAGKLVVTFRGVCARVDRATFAQRHGAAAVALINNATGFPPFEGDIAGVTIPFLGVRGPNATAGDGATLKAANGGTAKLTGTTIANPGFRRFASFSSGGPRNFDGALKPDITAPGVSTLSTLIGSGNGGVRLSGTSMATPHVSGVAALALQAHPDWDPENVRLAITNTADASQLLGYLARLGGSGLVQPFPATRTSVVARGTGDSGNLSFGIAEFSRDFTRSQRIKLRNLGSTPQTFSASVIPGAGSLHSVSVDPSTISVEPGESADVRFTLSVPAATSGAAGSFLPAGSFRQVSGLIAFSPTTATGNNGVALSVPYFLVPRARSEIEAEFSSDFGPATPATTASLSNESPAVTGTADFYAWGLRGKNKKAGTAGLRGVGVQAFDDATGATCTASTASCILVFAVNTFHPWTTPVLNEFDIFLDVDGDGQFDFAVFSQGLTSGRVFSVVVNLKTGEQIIRFFATAPTNESTILLPLLAKDIKVTAANPRFTYFAQGFDGFTGDFDFINATAKFNAFNSAVSNGAFVGVPPRSTTSVPLTINPTEFQVTPALGVMVVGLENFNGKKQASLLRIGGAEDDD